MITIKIHKLFDVETYTASREYKSFWIEYLEAALADREIEDYEILED